jgi:putative endonuclease
MKDYYVYILASKRNGTLYIGVTNDIMRRVGEHKHGTSDGFTKKYGVNMLVYLEWFSDINDAIRREKQLKKWNRQWKLELIEKDNPEWIDLSTVGYNTRNLDSRIRGNDNAASQTIVKEMSVVHVIPAPAGNQIPAPPHGEGLDSRPRSSRGQAIRGNDNAPTRAYYEGGNP